MSKAMARPTPKVQARWNEGQPPDELLLTNSGERRKWLSIFDFDGTLFRTPIKFMEDNVADPPNAGLKPPLVPQKPGMLWFDNESERPSPLRAAQARVCSSLASHCLLLPVPTPLSPAPRASRSPRCSEPILLSASPRRLSPNPPPPSPIAPHSLRGCSAAVRIRGPHGGAPERAPGVPKGEGRGHARTTRARV